MAHGTVVKCFVDEHTLCHYGSYFTLSAGAPPLFSAVVTLESLTFSSFEFSLDGGGIK